MRDRTSIWSTLLGALSIGVALVSANVEACSTCVGWPDGQGVNGGFYWSALLLTALPFAVLAVIGVWVSRAAWRRRSSRNSWPDAAADGRRDTP